MAVKILPKSSPRSVRYLGKQGLIPEIALDFEVQSASTNSDGAVIRVGIFRRLEVREKVQGVLNVDGTMCFYKCLVRIDTGRILTDSIWSKNNMLEVLLCRDAYIGTQEYDFRDPAAV